MPLARTRIDVRNELGQVNREIADGARLAVHEGAQVGAAVAAGVASQRVKTGTMANIQAGSPSRTVDGWIASFVSRAWYGMFQDRGTLGSRRRPLKQAPRTNRTREPGTGIEPLEFARAGRSAGRRAMLDRIRRSLPK